MPASALRQRQSRNAPARKGILFCPDCGYESPIDGNWIEVARDGGRNLACPDCLHVVVSQPEFR